MDTTGARAECSRAARSSRSCSTTRASSRGPASIKLRARASTQAGARTTTTPSWGAYLHTSTYLNTFNCIYTHPQVRPPALLPPARAAAAALVRRGRGGQVRTFLRRRGRHGEQDIIYISQFTISTIMYHISKYIYTQVRTRGQRCKKSRARHMSGAVSAVPHYATMSRCQQVNTEL